MRKLAFAMLRRRPGSALATLIALTAGVLILMSMGVLVESGLSYKPEPHRYAAADMVVAHRDITLTGKDFDGEVTRTTTALPEGGTVPAALEDELRALDGVASATGEPSAYAGRLDTIAVTFEPGADRAAVEQAVAEAGARTYTGADRGLLEQPDAVAARDLLIQIGGTFGGYVAMLVIFVVAGTIGLSVRHRRRDLALLRAVAATPGQVRRMIVAEAVTLAVVASALGVPAGLLATRWVQSRLVDRGFVPDGFPMVPGAVSALVVTVLTVVVAAAAALLAARRVTAIRPAEALGEIAVEPTGLGKVRAVLGLLALAAAGSATAFAVGSSGQSAQAGAIGMLYLFVTAVALLAPGINAIAARLLTPVLRLGWGVGGYLAAANLRANARGTATVLTSLVLSVGFGGSVWFLQDNLERATVSQSRAGLVADLALTSPEGLPGSAAADIRELPGVRAATGVRRTSVLIKFLDSAEPVPAQAVDIVGAAQTMDLAVSSGNLDDLNEGTVAVSTMQAGTSGWKLGDDVEFWLGDGTPVKLRLVALYDRGLGFGDVTLAKETVAGHTRADVDTHVLVRTEPGTTLKAPGLVSSTTLTSGLSRDLALSAWLNKLLIAVMVGYAALAAANTMVMAALARGRELSLLRLVGGTHRQLRRMVNAEQAGLLGIALIVGGTIAAATLSAVVDALTGDPVPYVPPLGWVAVIGGTTLLALFTTVLPVRRLLRTPPVEHMGTKQ
ncbi:ABC transporter permease [Actinoplanes sp. NPDC051494]|uniref:ABC transporter permease n=1 Tax=Actinoplanes sp. NPDC051494 TaxID=3363907 RepID=UPI0037B7B96A